MNPANNSHLNGAGGMLSVESFQIVQRKICLWVLCDIAAEICPENSGLTFVPAPNSFGEEVCPNTV